MKIEDALINLATDPDYPEYNFQLARCYEEDKQYTAAVSFYLRAAELTYDNTISYECLLRMYLCFKVLGNRWGMAEGLLLRAMSLMPERPEAYYLLCQYYEIHKKWHLSYSYACMGEGIPLTNPLRISIGIYKEWHKFQKAVAGWWIGLFTESVELFRELSEMSLLPDHVALSVKNNLSVITDRFMAGAKYGSNLEYPYYLNKDSNKYYSSLYHRYKFKFKGQSEITENYSQCYQDMFILSALNGKKNGRYLEIGCGVPKYNSNTYLLETKFGWRGTSIDINQGVVKLQKRDRLSNVINEDATKINYTELLKDYSDIDYLQVDCEPASTSYEILKRIPFDKHKFAVITFEHEYYIDENRDIRALSREYLQSLGYIMVVNDVAMDKFNTFEDWWIHPDLVDRHIIDTMTIKGNDVNNVIEYFMK